MAISPKFELSRNIPERLFVVLPVSGITTLSLVEITNPITGAAIVVLDTVLDPVVFPLALTQTPGNDQSWFTAELIIQTVGEFVAEFNPDVGINFTVPLEVSSEGGLPSPGMNFCRLEDYILGSDGEPMENVSVSARILGPPMLIDNVGISSDPVVVKTNAEGFFSITLVRGLIADIIIPEIGYRRQLTVPNTASSSLFTL